MLRFFRKIRQRLLTQNKVSKYLLYAVGEILLVVIGILIALQVDSWNEARNNDEKVRTILTNMMVELSSDINKTTNLMHYYSLRDSAIYLVLNDRVTREDYEKNEIPHLFNLTNFYNRVDLTEDSFSLLKQNLDIVPDEFEGALKNINRNYKINKKWVDKFDEDMGGFMDEIQEHLMKNYPWYSGTNSSDRKSRIEYMLNNFRYRNEVFEYRNLGIGNQLRFSLIYRQGAINCYKEIAFLLNRPTYDESFLFNQEASKILIGDWEVEGEPGVIVSFFEDDKRLYFTDNINSGRNEVFWLPSYKILIDNLLYGSLVNNGEEYIIKFNGFGLKRVDK